MKFILIYKYVRTKKLIYYKILEYDPPKILDISLSTYVQERWSGHVSEAKDPSLNFTNIARWNMSHMFHIWSDLPFSYVLQASIRGRDLPLTQKKKKEETKPHIYISLERFHYLSHGYYYTTFPTHWCCLIIIMNFTLFSHGATNARA